MSIRGSVTSMRYSPRRSPSPPITSSRPYILPCGKKITSEGLPTTIDRDKLNLFLSGGLSTVTNNVAQKFVPNSIFLKFLSYCRKWISYWPGERYKPTGRFYRCTYRTMYCAAKTGDVEKVLACLGTINRRWYSFTPLVVIHLRRIIVLFYLLFRFFSLYVQPVDWILIICIVNW